MPDDQNNSQYPQLNNNQPTSEPIEPVQAPFPAPVEAPAPIPIQEPVQIAPQETVQTPFQTPFGTPLQETTPLPPPVTPGIIGSGPEPVVAPVVAPKKSKKGLFIGLAIVLGLAILGGGSALAYNLVYQNPDKVVTDALVSTIGARTAQLTGTFDLKNDDYTIKLAIDGKSGTENAELAVKLDYTTAGSTYKLDGIGHFSKEGDIYVKVNNVKEVFTALMASEDADLTMFDDLITKVEGNWIKISKDDLGNFSEEYKETQACIETVANDIKANKALSEEVFNLYDDNRFIIVKESLGSRTINGVGSLGYVIDVDTAKTKSFIAGLEATEVGKKLKACDDSYDFKKAADNIDTTKEEEATDGQIQLWASRFGHELTEINAAGKNEDVELKFVVNPVFNKDVNLETPANSMSVDDLQAEIEAAYTEYYTSMYSQYYPIEQ